MLKQGDKLPVIKLADQSGEVKGFKDLAGPKGLVLYAYSRDNTSGCSAEAGEFQERLEAFQALGYGVAGISKDSTASHQKFAAKLGLGFALLSDPDTAYLAALGSWAEKKMYGKVGMGAIRSTFVSDGRGKLKKVYVVKKAKGHAQAVLEDLSQAAK